MSPETVEPKLTPMMEQYRSIKKNLPPETILFFRLGDFYEMFFEDALRASEILNITLTGREGGEAGRVPMCGVPYHSYSSYVRTLIDHNLKVAVCEQVGDPRLAKGIVERKITRIISPATYLEDENKGKNSEYMVAVAGDGRRYALSYLELSTGEFCIREVERDRFLGELSLLDPREVILPRSESENPELAAFIRETLHATFTIYENWIFEYEEGLRLLIDGFQLVSAHSLSFHDHPLAVRASGAVLYYLRDHLYSDLRHIRPPLLLDASDFMILDRPTQRSLELVAPMNSKTSGERVPQGTLLSCLDQTLTSMGGRRLHHWITHPLLSLSEIRRRQGAVRHLTANVNSLQTLRDLFKGVRDMERTLSRLNCGVANARDLVNLKIFLERVPLIRETLRAVVKTDTVLLKEILDLVTPFPDIQEWIGKAIADNPPLGLRDGGIIRDGYSKELDELRDISRNGKSWILDFERREAERTGVKSLKVKYSQVFGYTIEVSKSNLHLVPQEYHRKQTLANGERFIVPELCAWDEKISGAEEKIKALEYQLFEELRRRVLGELAPLQKMANATGVLDGLGALAVVALQKKWVCPEVLDSFELRIVGGRHPVVEMSLPAGGFVENDAFLDRGENQLIILTGPNMAGKSTYIRQIAQIVLLAQMGSFVPAHSARIGLVDRIFTRIGATDDLARGESTFMVEMVETSHILQKATERSLLILDEVGRGTSTFDGVSIAWAICEHLAQGPARPRTLFATHYHELTQLEGHSPGIKNYNITVRETGDGIIFLRKVIRGGSDRSYGIHVARLAGIPDAVTKRAKEILSILETESSEATEIIEGKIKGKPKKGSEFQPLLFEVKKENDPILDEIRQLLIEVMSPLDALNKIAGWKKKLS